MESIDETLEAPAESPAASVSSSDLIGPERALLDDEADAAEEAEKQRKEAEEAPFQLKISLFERKLLEAKLRAEIEQEINEREERRARLVQATQKSKKEEEEEEEEEEEDEEVTL
eukprot:Skav209968  [mRNA]  locus=scaffold4929:30561:34165:- [translate_table: standard]